MGQGAGLPLDESLLMGVLIHAADEFTSFLRNSLGQFRMIRRLDEMRRIRLTATEQVHLGHLFKTAPDRRLRDWCQAGWMASRGLKRQTIAQD